MPNPVDATRVCDDLAAFLDEEPEKRMNAAKLAKFYKKYPHYESFVKSFKIPSQPRGIRSICGSDTERFGFSKDRTGKGVILCIYRTSAIETPLQSIQNHLSVNRFRSFQGGEEDSLPEVEAMLQELNLDGTSIRKMKAEVREKGICLKDGSECGPNLHGVLRKNRALQVNRERAKKFPLARMCLVTL